MKNYGFLFIVFAAVIYSFGQDVLVGDDAVSSYERFLNTLSQDERYKVRRFVIKTGDSQEELPIETLLKMEESEITAIKIFLTMQDEQKITIKNLFENENNYYSARNKLRIGLIMGGGSIAAAGLFGGFAAAGASVSDGDENLGNIILMVTGIGGLFVSAAAFTVSIPFTIVGAYKVREYKKYKPFFAFSPNNVKFVMEF